MWSLALAEMRVSTRFVGAGKTKYIFQIWHRGDTANIFVSFPGTLMETKSILKAITEAQVYEFYGFEGYKPKGNNIRKKNNQNPG